MEFSWLPVLIMYFSALTGGSGLLPGVAWIGLVSLIVGTVWGIDKREVRLLWFLVPLALSELALIVPFSLERSLSVDEWAAAVFWLVVVYIPLQALVLVRILYVLYRRGNGAHKPGLLIAAFVSAYALIPVLILIVAVAATD